MNEKLKTWNLNPRDVYILIKQNLNLLQILRGPSVVFHFLISFSKPLRESLFLVSAGICSQIFSPKYNADSVPL